VSDWLVIRTITTVIDWCFDCRVVTPGCQISYIINCEPWYPTLPPLLLPRRWLGGGDRHSPAASGAAPPTGAAALADTYTKSADECGISSTAVASASRSCRADGLYTRYL
jgi:hypothetical protein